MSYNYLDKTGLASVWAKIKAALATKANSADLATVATSGSYEDLNDIPEILTTNDDVVTEDQIHYLFRKSPDSDRAVEEIVGGTVGWNQMCKNGDFSNGSNYWAKSDSQDSYSIDNGVYTLTLSSTPVNYYGHRIQNNPSSSISGHKVLCSCYMRSSKQCGFIIGLTNSTPASGLSKANTANQWSQVSNIMSVNANGTYSLQCSPGYSYSELSAGDTIDIKNVIITDLTTMFGTTIADYIYSLEQSTAGAGVAKLKEWGFFTEDYYEYCEPTLRSVEGLVSKKTVGFNQWDEEWEVGAISSATGINAPSNNQIRNKNYIHVIPGQSYFFSVGSSPYVWLWGYDVNKNYVGRLNSGNGVSSTALTIPNEMCYIRFICPSTYGTTYNHDICINLSDPTKNGTYEPYESHTYSLDSEVVLRGVPKLDSSNNLYYDGDVYPSDGNGSRRYGLVDLGTLNWTKQTNYGFYSTSLSSLIKSPTANTVKANIFCLSKTTATWNELATGGTETNYIAVSSGYLGVADSRDISAPDFKTAMSGIYLLYELATPTTFTAQPYHNPQIVGDTEEFVTTGLVPVGHSTKYHTSYYTTNDYIKEKGYLTEKDILGKVNISDLATVATSGSYNDLGDTPTKVSDFENDAAYMSGMTILAYGKSNWTDFITAYTEQKVVYCRASSQSNPASGSQTRLAFMAYVNSADNPTEVEFQYYRSVSSHSNNQQGDQVYVYKLTKSGGWTVTVRESYTKVVAGTGLSGNWASGAITLSLNGSATATTSANGLMSSTDKSRLDELYADYSSALTALGGS